MATIMAKVFKGSSDISVLIINSSEKSISNIGNISCFSIGLMGFIAGLSFHDQLLGKINSIIKI